MPNLGPIPGYPAGAMRPEVAISERNDSSVKIMLPDDSPLHRAISHNCDDRFSRS
jgi:hypothetical protein